MRAPFAGSVTQLSTARDCVDVPLPMLSGSVAEQRNAATSVTPVAGKLRSRFVQIRRMWEGGPIRATHMITVENKAITLNSIALWKSLRLFIRDVSEIEAVPFPNPLDPPVFD